MPVLIFLIATHHLFFYLGGIHQNNKFNHLYIFIMEQLIDRLCTVAIWAVCIAAGSLIIVLDQCGNRTVEHIAMASLIASLGIAICAAVPALILSYKQK